MTQALNNPASAGTDADDVAHVVCHFDVDYSYCGRDVTEDPWAADGESVTVCETCEEFWREGFCAHCAMGEGS